MIQKYLNDVLKTARAGDATEQSYYSDLKNLLQNFLSSKGFDPSITVQAKRQIAGIPDFTVRKGRELIGYIEAKDPKYDNLENLPKRDTEQLKRYLEKLPNIILTNFFDFWLYREGKLIKKARIGFPNNITELKTNSPAINEGQLMELLDLYFAYYIPETKTPKVLAKELARRAHLLTQTIVEELNNDEETEIDRIYNAFKEFLISDLSPDGFADIYAQTLTYGLFTARLNCPGKGFDRKMAGEYIPKSITILRDTFNLISGDAIPESLESYIDDIATILAHANIEEIKRQLKSSSGDSDPLIHFYETFLAEYDPAKRKSLGVYYTPLPVVSCIVRSVNKLLKEKFDIKDGVAGDEVTLLDPAAGTLTFPAESIKEAVKESKKFSDSTSSLKEHFLTHFFAFEYQMAAYIIGHLRMSLLFEELGMPLDERFPLYLTNSLDFSKIHQSGLPFVADLAKEAEEALEVKQKDILVVLGNPPYTSEKKEKGELPDWIKEKLQDYLKGLGVEKEKKKGVLQDDYIRFLRFAHWKIDQYGKGIVAFITNNSYLDGIIHRSMRKQLLESFDEIYILNLHGNSRIHEKTPEGGKDENVFDIQQGVAIAIFVKTGQKKETKIYHKDLLGLREEKYQYLNNHLIDDSELAVITPQPEEFYFIPKDYSLKSKYDSWFALDEIFEQFVSGVETKRDDLVVDYKKESVSNRILSFANLDGDNDFILKAFNLSDKSDLDISFARRKLRETDISDEIVQYLYRPFDLRFLFYHDSLVSRTRRPLMDVLANKGNIALLAMREYFYNAPYSHALVVDNVVDRRVFISNRGAAYIFPLFACQNDSNQSDLFGKSNHESCNFSPDFWHWWEKNISALDDGTDPWNVFYYIYAVLYSESYRTRYLDFLKSGFPRIPFTTDPDLFFKISKLGNQLADLHLLKADVLDEPSVRLDGEDGNEIEKRKWKDNQLWINANQYFAPVPEQAWQYYFGGYQVADKWLKDRQNRSNARLTKEEVKTYCQMITAIMHTIIIQKEIGRLYPRIEETTP